MSIKYTKILNEIISSKITISTYELDKSLKSALELHLKEQVKKIKPIASFVNYWNPIIKEKFLNRLKEQLRYKKKIQFDKRREFITEFMAQALLEKEHGIIFWEELDKKINIDPIRMKKSADWMDVTWIKLDTCCKFVVCEVKASDQDKAKVKSSTELLQEIEKASSSDKWRLLDELNNYLYKIWLIEDSDEKILQLLEQLIENIKLDDSSDDIINKNIIFIPFLIRKKRSDIEDFKEIVDYKTLKEKEVVGIIWWFDENISNFCIKLFDSAVDECI